MENSSNGSVVQTLDLLADRNGELVDLSVCGEHYMTVHHSLLMNKRRNATGSPKREGDKDYNEDHSLARMNDVKVLYTHPQVWGQCEHFLQRHLHGVTRQDTSSSATAAEIVAKSGEIRSGLHDQNGEHSGLEDEDKHDGGSCAAVASKFALSRCRDLEVVAENIEDVADNTTRFFILRNSRQVHEKDGILPPGFIIDNPPTETSNPTSPSQNKARTKKCLITFTINHNLPGALADALLIFKTHHLNLTSINSRPSRVRPWHYVFFVECEYSQSLGKNEIDCYPTTLGAIVQELAKLTESSRNLGSWWNQLQQGEGR